MPEPSSQMRIGPNSLLYTSGQPGRLGDTSKGRISSGNYIRERGLGMRSKCNNIKSKLTISLHLLSCSPARLTVLLSKTRETGGDIYIFF